MKNPFGKIYVELDNKLTNITELKREYYELFLKLTGELNLAYWVAIHNEERIKKEKEETK